METKHQRPQEKCTITLDRDLLEAVMMMSKAQKISHSEFIGDAIEGFLRESEWLAQHIQFEEITTALDKLVREGKINRSFSENGWLYSYNSLAPVHAPKEKGRKPARSIRSPKKAKRLQ